MANQSTPQRKIRMAVEPQVGSAPATANAQKPVVRPRVESSAKKSAETPKPASAPKIAVAQPKPKAAAPTQVTPSAPKAAVSAPKPAVSSPRPEPSSKAAPKMSVASFAEKPAPKQSAAKMPIAAEPEFEAEPGPVREEAPKAAPEQPAEEAKKEAPHLRQSVVSWVRQTFPGHEHAFWGGLIALIVALLVFAIGIWRVLFIGVVVLIGIAIGQVLDGDLRLVNAIRGLFDNDRGQGI